MLFISCPITEEMFNLAIHYTNDTSPILRFFFYNSIKFIIRLDLHLMNGHRGIQGVPCIYTPYFPTVHCGYKIFYPAIILGAI